MADGRLWLGKPHAWWSERGIEITAQGLRTWRPWLRPRIRPWTEVVSVDLAAVGIPEGSAKKDAVSAAVILSTGSEVLDVPYGLLSMTVRGRGFAEVYTHQADLTPSAATAAPQVELRKAEELVMAMATHAELRALLSDERLIEAMLEVLRQTPRVSELRPRLRTLSGSL